MRTLHVPADLDSLKTIREFVMQAAFDAGLEPPKACRLRLGVDEIAANIIQHGYAQMASEQIVRVCAEEDAQCLKIILEDRGQPYDPRQVPPLESFEMPLESRQVGGLGLYLTVNSVDRLEYERCGAWNRIIVTMEKE